MAKLGELYKITSGGTPSRTHSEYYEDGTIRFIKLEIFQKMFWKAIENLKYVQTMLTKR